MRLDAAIDKYKIEHLDSLATGDERHKQLNRVLESNSCSEMHSVTNADLSNLLSRWKGSTRNRYRAALTHFWKWGRANGHTDLHPTLLPGKESPRDKVLTLNQLRRLYVVADRQGDWADYGRLLILTGQRHSDLMRFDLNLLSGFDLNLPTSKNGMPHIVPLGFRAWHLVVGNRLPYRQFTTTAHFKKRWFRASGIPMTFQLRDIRRSMATHLAEHGENEADVDRLLNHVASASAVGVARVYNRARRIQQRRDIIARWESLLFPDE